MHDSSLILFVTVLENLDKLQKSEFVYVVTDRHDIFGLFSFVHYAPGTEIIQLNVCNKK